MAHHVPEALASATSNPQTFDDCCVAEDRPAVSLLPSCQDLHSLAIRHAWDEWVAASNNIDVLFQSPTWFDHIAATDLDKRLTMAVARHSDGHIEGLAPLIRGRFPLRFEVKNRLLWNSSITSIFIFGGEALFPPRPDLYDELFGLIDGRFADDACICFFSLLKDSFCWTYLQESPLINDRFLIYMPGGVRPYHAVEMSSTFEEYLKKFNSKKRYNLQRQLKLLEKAAGPLRLEKIQTPEHVPAFFEAATRIAHQSWQFAAMGTVLDATLEEIVDLAKRELLRSYLLMAGDRPCAYVLGYQFRDVYYYAHCGYDQTYAATSPGTGLLYLLIKDLIENSTARRLSFDYGDAGYKREFGNIHAEDATVLLLRKTLSNRLRRHIHGAFGSVVQGLKSWLRGRPNGIAH